MTIIDPTRAAALARAAQQAWADAGLTRRLETIERAGAGLRESRDALVDALASDGFSTEMARYWADWIVAAASARKLRADARLLARCFETRGGGEIVVRRPDGVVLLDPPSNSAGINTAPIFSILLAGNAVLARTSGSRAQRLLVEGVVRPALVESGFDERLVGLVEGRSRDVALQLLPGASVDTVVFFGGASGGAALEREAREHGTKVVAELGGSDHMAVWSDADLVVTSASAHRAWHVSTQPCLVPKHILVHGSVFDAFVSRFLADLPEHGRTVEADRVGGRLVPVARIDRFVAAFEELAAVGKVRAGGYRMGADGTRDDAGVYVAPTVVEVPASAVLERPLLAFRDEIAFPLLPVVRFGGDDDAVLDAMTTVMQASPFGLRASVWTRSRAVMAHFARRLGGVGILVFDDDHARSPEVASAWGGPKRSGGPGGESYVYAEKTSHAQSIVVNGGPESVRAIGDALGIPPGWASE
jgi:acyl-CoA reductase-like NAD-dependent aldehyde dehydrogenase